MLAFRVLLALIASTVLVYTGFVISLQGWNFMPVFFRDIVALTWSGQFNLDFSGLLLLAGLWLAWRHRFSPFGIGLGVLPLVAGAPLLSIYLLVASVRARGDMKVLLLGSARAQA